MVSRVWIRGGDVRTKEKEEAGVHALAIAVVDAVRRDNLIRRGARVLVAVSGGVDSLVLLHVLHSVCDRWDAALVVCHVHHRLRKEADDEAAHVRSVCAAWGIPCAVRAVDWDSDDGRGRSIQDRARDHRYALLTEVARDYGCTDVALGHHRGDQAETVLIRLLHGAGVHGLAAMRTKRKLHGDVALIRPMLAVSKEDIMAYAREQGIVHVHDASNDCRSYVRNVVRQDVVPVLRAIQPRIEALLSTTAAVCASEDDVLASLAQEARARICIDEGTAVTFDRRAFLSLPLALQSRLFALLLSDMNVQRKALDAARLWDLCSVVACERPTTGTWDIDAHVVLVREYAMMRLALRRAPLSRTPSVIDVANDGCVQDIVWRTVARGGDAPWRGASLHEAWFDARLLNEHRLVVRGRQRGDRVTRLQHGTKAVSDVFIDAKIPARVRQLVPLVAWEDGHILWIPTLHRSPYALVSDHTEDIVHMWCTMDELGDWKRNKKQ
jgi:tRNA(Ile)-lysidine synthase